MGLLKCKIPSKNAGNIVCAFEQFFDLCLSHGIVHWVVLSDCGLGYRTPAFEE